MEKEQTEFIDFWSKRITVGDICYDTFIGEYVDIIREISPLQGCYVDYTVNKYGTKIQLDREYARHLAVVESWQITEDHKNIKTHASTLRSSIKLIVAITWISGIVIAKGFWSTFFAIFFQLWAFYLVVEKLLYFTGVM